MYHAQFVRFLAPRTTAASQSRCLRWSPLQQMTLWKSLKRLVGAGSWPPYAEAVRLFEDGVEIDSFVPELHQERAA